MDSMNDIIPQQQKKSKKTHKLNRLHRENDTA